MSNISNLLAASGLFVASISLVFSSWYGELSDTIRLRAEINPQDRKEQTAKVRNVLLCRVLPLLVAVSGISLILLPTIVEIVGQFFVLGTAGFYDPLKAIMFLTWVFTIFLTAVIGNLGFGLIKMIRRLRA